MQWRRRPRRWRGITLATALAAGMVAPALLGAGAPATAAVTLNDSDVTANLWEWNWDSVSAACTNHLGPAGYGAVQVAPPQESVSLPTSDDGVHPWWEVYQPVSYKLESRFGTRAEFAAMVTACHAAGVRVYVDAVVNHMAGTNNSYTTGYAGTSFSPTGYSYPAVPFGYNDFHHPGSGCPTGGGINDWNNEAQVTGCELLSLSDLRTGDESVRNKIAAYLNDLIGLGVDGFRVDAVKHVSKPDFAAILGKLNNTAAENKRPYVAQEIFDGASNPALQAAAFTGNGDVLDFAYAKGIRSAFQGSISALANVGNWALDAPSANVFSMVTNHDLERDGVVLSYKNGTDYVLANYFALAYPHGKPSVYDSFTWSVKGQSPPADGNGYVTDTVCGAAWNCLTQTTGIKGMVGWHNAAKSVSTVSNFTTTNSNVIGFSRGDKGWIGINDSGSASTATYQTGLANGVYCDVITGVPDDDGCTGSSVTVSGGSATVTIPANSAFAVHVNAKSGEGPSPSPTPTTPTPTPTPTPTDPTNPATVAANFNVYAETVPGENVYVVGNTAALGSWNTANAVQLSASGYPVWTGSAALPANTTVEYKFIKKTAGGTVTWESNPNRTVATGTSAVTVNNSWNLADANATALTFNVNATTNPGTNVYVVGSLPSLGSWNPAHAIPLSATGYPVWSRLTIVPKNTTFQYKFIKKDANGTVTWENGGNRSYGTGSGGSYSVSATWN
ncbi:carbohydrate-binding module family 20 domain-containing protein [Actinocorallia sp. A-T 12471]|uniref:carbohydrate-binding module family 20 domain-containing protein n=1 Tax=Actinocorallia sp. A-T 12471 TaxID=3089813 RepID=UPI0029CDA494|nr:carbohydrate-binding module family 20 domain-containing protein [Actinocorallia sp. A-T 12471]MDX6739268.1 carbohydrate-binding module family 20 domain-containing protein [Actinocorallia sp. A-T 12471]